MTNQTETDFIEKTTLENGLTVVTEKVESVKSVSVGIWAKTGSRHETEAQAGVTHFLEHMLFKGTEKRSSYDIALSMESVGGYLNAFTSSEYTCYFARCLDTQLDQALDVLSDMVLHPAFPKDEIEKEKKVVIEEMKMYRDSPSDYLLQNFNRAVFKGHPLERPVIGFEETVSDFERQDLYNYMDERYQPDNLLISVAGHVEHEKVIDFVSDYFQEIKKEDGDQDFSSPGAYAVSDQSLSKAIEQTHLMLGRRGLNYDHDDRYKLLLVNTLLGGGMSSRLHQNVREKYGYCYSISTFNQTYRDTGLYGIYVGTDEDYVDHVEELIYEELNRLKTEAVPDQELEDAKTQLKGKLLLSLESMSNRMRRLAKNEIYFERFVPLDELVENIEAVESSDIQDFAHEFFDTDLFSKAVLLPES